MASTREAAAHDPSGNRTHISGEAHEIAEQYEHARPLPLRRPPPLTELDEAYRNGCVDTANALRLGIAADLESRGLELAKEKREGEAAELFTQAARIRGAVKL